jgi:hypothetical protein
MPNIEEYSAGNLSIQPSETGVESTARAAYRIASFGNQQAADLQRVGQELGSAVKDAGDIAMQYAAHREINTGAPHAATISASKDQAWNNYITGRDIDPSDPDRETKIAARVNNPQAAEQWREQNLDPDLQKFTDAFWTDGAKQWATEWADRYRTHFTTMAHADQATMAGEVVKANIEKTNNAAATGVFNVPGTLGSAADLLKHSIEGNVRSSPTMTPDVATGIENELYQKGMEQLVQAAVQGSILKGGNWKAIADDPKYAPYIKPAENAAFEKQEQFYQKGIEASERQIITAKKQEAEFNAGTAVNNSFNQNVHVDDQGNVTINPQYMKDLAAIPGRFPNAPNATALAESKLDWAISKQKPPAVRDDAQTADALLSTITNPQTTRVDADIAIDKAAAAKGITEKTEANMRRLAGDVNSISDPAFAQVMKGAQDIVEPKISGVPASGAGAAFYYNFVENVYLPQQRAGTLPANALDLNDPKSLISQSVASFKPNLPQAIGANGGIGAQPALPVYTASRPAPAAPKPPATGDVVGGYRFKGGDPADKANWEPAT